MTADPASDVVTYEIGPRGVARITINRPDVRNAWNPEVVSALHAAIGAASQDCAVRVVILTGAGKSFSAGGDLRWMRGILDQSEPQRRDGARRIGDLLAALDACPKPTVARVNGAAVGGGLGLVCACDIAVASEDAVFGLSEVRLGIVPAMIAPYVVRRVGEARARAHFMTGRDPIAAGEALGIGLVHRVVARERLDSAIGDEIAAVLRSAPGAVAETKRLFRSAAALDGDAVIKTPADMLVRIWDGDEARQGLSAFLEKRMPSW